jgi:hypothetical protein
LLSEEFSQAASAAWNRARQDALKNGHWCPAIAVAIR